MKFTNIEGKIIVENIIKKIQENKDYLSEIDGAIGDGDHGINMNKGATLAVVEVNKDENLCEALGSLAKVLMNKIGGSMGPLYGSIFMGMQMSCKNKEFIDGDVLKAMLNQAYENIKMISPAKPNDKTLVDVLDPAINAYNVIYEESNDVIKALNACIEASTKGMLATKDMQAKLGRASRLGEKSIGFQDAGATSCSLIINTLCESAIELLK